MTHSAKLLLTTLTTTILLAITVGNATATSLEVSETRWRITWASLELGNTAGIGNTLRCRVTLEGSFHARTIPKVLRSLIGLVTSAIVDGANCTGGSATINRETLPWHTQYGGFRGTLPRIETITLLLVGASFRINNESATCDSRTETGEPAAGIASVEEGGAITGVEADPSRRIALTGGLCSLARGFFRGNGNPTVQGSSTRIRVMLIGEPAPSSLTPSPVTFGTVEPGELARRTVTITAGAAATVNSISMANANYFAITDPNRCVGTRLAERGTCRFSVIFAAPSEAGRSVEDTVSVVTNLETLRDTVRGST